MQAIAKAISYLALAGIVVPPVLYLTDSLSLSAVKLWLLVATVVWFATVPLWMGRKSGTDATKP